MRANSVWDVLKRMRERGSEGRDGCRTVIKPINCMFSAARQGLEPPSPTPQFVINKKQVLCAEFSKNKKKNQSHGRIAWAQCTPARFAWSGVSHAKTCTCAAACVGVRFVRSLSHIKPHRARASLRVRAEMCGLSFCFIAREK